MCYRCANVSGSELWQRIGEEPVSRQVEDVGVGFSPKVITSSARHYPGMQWKKTDKEENLGKLRQPCRVDIVLLPLYIKAVGLGWGNLSPTFKENLQEWNNQNL